MSRVQEISHESILRVYYYEMRPVHESMWQVRDSTASFRTNRTLNQSMSKSDIS